MVDHVHEVVGTRRFILPYREDYCQNTVHRDQSPYHTVTVLCTVHRVTLHRAESIEDEDGLD